MFILISAALLAVPSGPDPIPAAMIVRMHGSVEVESYGESARRPATMDILYPGDTVRAGINGEITMIFLGDKHTERLKPGCSAVLTGHGCEPSRSVEPSPAVRSGTLAGGQNVRPLRVNGRGAGVVFR